MVLVLVEQSEGSVDDLSLQGLAFAREVASQFQEPFAAVVAGKPEVSVVDTLSRNGVTHVYGLSDSSVDGYAPVAIARGISEICAAQSPQAVIGVSTDHGNEVLAHLAAILDLPLSVDTLSFSPGSAGTGSSTVGAPAKVTRARWGGSLIEHAEIVGNPLLMTVAAHVQAPSEVDAVATEVVMVEPTLTELDGAVVASVERVEGSSTVSLADAKVVVSGGRGVGGSEGFVVLEELADLLGGAVGCSRVVTSAGWRPHTDQVGQTGTKVAPDLYIACGISGATQHLAGCRTSKTMLVINNDPEASIMSHADYAVIGDLHKVLPAIVAEVRTAKRQL